MNLRRGAVMSNEVLLAFGKCRGNGFTSVLGMYFWFSLVVLCRLWEILRQEILVALDLLATIPLRHLMRPLRYVSLSCSLLTSPKKRRGGAGPNCVALKELSLYSWFLVSAVKIIAKTFRVFSMICIESLLRQWAHTHLKTCMDFSPILRVRDGRP